MKIFIDSAATKGKWEKAVSLFKEANFLQSWNWGVFHQALGKTVIRILFVTNDMSFSDNQVEGIGNVLGLSLLVVERARRGSYITIAGGPIMDWQNKELFHFVFQEIKKIAKDYKVDFIRFRPQEPNSLKLREKLVLVGFRPSQMHLTADLTLQLDLSQTEEELLSGMRKNHRSAIKRSNKLRIVVKKTNNPSEIREFHKQQLILAQKHGFVPFSYEFWYEQFKAFVQDNQVLLFHSYYQNKLLASAFIIFYNGEAVYHYGISTEENNKLPGSYACQWAAIQEAKNRGCLRYNFWGIAPKGEKDHRFAGVSLFKTGFGGQEVEYLHAYDIPMSFKYNLVALFEFLRRKLRRL